MPRDYQPFQIRVGELEAGGFPVEAEFQGTTRSGRIPASLPLLSGGEVAEALRWLERAFHDRDYAQDFGSRLFRTLFDGSIGELFRLAYERVALARLSTRRADHHRAVLPARLPPGGRRCLYQ